MKRPKKAAAKPAKKQRPWWQPSNPPAWLLKKSHAGRGISTAFVDRAFWLDNPDEPWIAALEALDQHDNAAPLLALLPAEMAPHFRDLFVRKRLISRKPGTPATPSYDRSANDALLELAVGRVRDLVKSGMLVKTAIGQIAAQGKIPENILRNEYRGKRGSTQRKKKRRV